MRKILWILTISVVSARAEISKLEALGMIESGNNDAAIGDAGEVSRYQIKPRIWRDYSQSRAYRDSRVSSKVAERYLADLEQAFHQRTGREPSDFDRYVLWNAGPAYYAKVRFFASRVHPIIRERAQRYANLRKMEIKARPGAVLVQAPRPGLDLKRLMQPLPMLVTESAAAAPVPLVGTTPAPAVAVALRPASPQEMLAVGGIRLR